MKRLNIYGTILLVFVLLVSCNNSPGRNLYPKELVGGFNLLPSEQTGIDFNNSIKESTYFNHYYFSQIYVGSGVAIGDINNDGLINVSDIVIMVSNIVNEDSFECILDIDGNAIIDILYVILSIQNILSLRILLKNLKQGLIQDGLGV